MKTFAAIALCFVFNAATAQGHGGGGPPHAIFTPPTALKFLAAI